MEVIDQGSWYLRRISELAVNSFKIEAKKGEGFIFEVDGTKFWADNLSLESLMGAYCCFLAYREIERMK